MTIGNDTLCFTADTVTFTNTVYGFVKNLQGDIVTILNSSKTNVVRYVYDALGYILSMSDTAEISLGALNPLRYRRLEYDS